MTRRAAKDLERRWRGRVLGAVLRRLSRHLARRPLARAQRFGRGVGRLAWWLGRRDRRRALAHLELALPELPAAERRRIARASMVHLGVNLGETLHLGGADCAAVESYVDVVGWEHLAAVQAAGRPLVLFTGHCGNWELLAALVGCRGVGIHVVGRRLEAPELQEQLLAVRRRFGVETIERGEAGAARRLLGVLRTGGALGLLIDQDIRGDSVSVPFFGRPANTPVGAAKIALKLDAAVLPLFIERRADGRHRMTLHPPLDLPPDPTAATAAMTAAIEAQVRRVPEQWVWLHRRWRR